MRISSPDPSNGGPGLSAGKPSMDYLPVFLQLHERPALVVGGGRVAARKVELIRRTGARITLVAPSLTEELRELADRGEIQYVAAPFSPEHISGMDVVVAATSSEEVNALVSLTARRERIPVNVVDDPDKSTFIFPAIVDRSPILIAISSGGAAPVLARRVREQLEALIPARLGDLARFMGERRAAVKRALRTAARRSFWERIVGGITGAKLLAGDEAQANKEFERELRTTSLTRSAATGAKALGECYLIGAGPGDPDLLTVGSPGTELEFAL